LHALWTLEGLDSISDDLLIEKLKDTDPRLREAAVRIAEPRVTQRNAAIVTAMKALATDRDAKVAAQLCLSMLASKHPDGNTVVTATPATPRDGAGNETVKSLVDKYRDNLKKAAEQAAKDAEMAKADKAKGELFVKGRSAYNQTCIACHATNGKGMPAPEHNGTTLAPPLAGSRRLLADKQLVARIVLHGLVGPNNGVTYPGQMASFKWATDEWIASILAYARNDWGNKADAILPQDIAALRQLTGDRMKPFTLEELYATVEAGAPVTANGAHVLPAPGEIIVDPSTAELHGSIRVDCYPSGLDIGYWDNWQDWVSWKIPHLDPGDYKVSVRTCSPDQAHDFSIRIGNQELPGTSPKTKSWEDYRDVPVGVVHIGQGDDVGIEFRPRSADKWGPTNVSAVRLIPAESK
jgi:mono/diheme cytochrome c family protein